MNRLSECKIGCTILVHKLNKLYIAEKVFFFIFISIFANQRQTASGTDTKLTNDIYTTVQ